MGPLGEGGRQDGSTQVIEEGQQGGVGQWCQDKQAETRKPLFPTSKQAKMCAITNLVSKEVFHKMFIQLFLLGATVFQKIYVFLKKVQTASTAPLPSLFGNFIALFHKYTLTCINFWTFFQKFTTKIYRFETNKICNVIFWIGNDPPRLGTFPKRHPYLGERTSLSK